MAKPKSIYRRATGRYRTLLGYSQLWMAPNHLLLLKSTRFGEDYRRFAFSDIQAVVITELPDSQVIQFVLLLGALLWTALAATVSSSFGRGFFLITGAWLLALAILNLARGQRCRCHLYTAVSRELLTPVRRVRTARKFLARLRPAIEEVQGSLAAEALTEAQGMLPEQSYAELPPKMPPPAVGYGMEILFGLILLDAVLIPLSQRFKALQSETAGVLLTCFFAELALAVFVLFGRNRHDPRRVGLVLTGIALACMLADVFGIGRSTMTWFGQLMQAAQRQQTTPPPFVWAASPPWLFFAFGWRVFTGLAGLAAARMQRTEKVA